MKLVAVLVIVLFITVTAHAAMSAPSLTQDTLVTGRNNLIGGFRFRADRPFNAESGIVEIQTSPERAKKVSLPDSLPNLGITDLIHGGHEPLEMIVLAPGYAVAKFSIRRNMNAEEVVDYLIRGDIDHTWTDADWLSVSVTDLFGKYAGAEVGSSITASPPIRTVLALQKQSPIFSIGSKVTENGRIIIGFGIKNALPMSFFHIEGSRDLKSWVKFYPYGIIGDDRSAILGLSFKESDWGSFLNGPQVFFRVSMTP